MNSSMISRLALSAALTVGLGAPAWAEDRTEVRIVDNGQPHAISIDLDGWAVGESRQLTASTGLPALVSRNADGLRIELAGKVTEVFLGLPEGGEWTGLMDADGDASQVKIVRHHSETVDADGKQQTRVIIRRHDGAADPAAAVSDAELEALLDEADLQPADGDAHKVIVIRRRSEQDASQP